MTLNFLVILLAEIVLNHQVASTTSPFQSAIAPSRLATLDWHGFWMCMRDIDHVTGIFASVILCIYAVLCPPPFPEQYKFWMRINTLAVPIERGQSVLLFSPPNLMAWALMMGIEFAKAWTSSFEVQKTRKGFADVL